MADIMSIVYIFFAGIAQSNNEFHKCIVAKDQSNNVSKEQMSIGSLIQ